MDGFFNIDSALNLVLALIMMGLGLSLTKSDFRNLLIQPKALAIGLFAQMVLLPLVALLMVSFTNLSPALKTGFFIISLCPGGITSNLVSYIVKGNVALAISLTVSNALITLITIPLLTNWGLNYFSGENQSIHLPVWSTMFEIFIITIIPALLGIGFRSKFPRAAVKFERPLNFILPALLLTVFLIKFLANPAKGGTGITPAEIGQLTGFALLLNLSAMLIGYLCGTLFGLVYRNKITISIEVGLHNTALALLITGTLLHDAEMQKPALVYAIFSFFTTLLIAFLLKSIQKKLSNRKDSE